MQDQSQNIKFSVTGPRKFEKNMFFAVLNNLEYSESFYILEKKIILKTFGTGHGFLGPVPRSVIQLLLTFLDM